MARVQGIVFPHCSRVNNRRVERVTIIFDFKDVNVLQLAKGEMKQVVDVLLKQQQNYFPESAKRILVMNTSTMFGVLWNLVKLFLDKEIIKRVQIHSKNTLEVLSQYVDPANLPQFLGGQCPLDLSENPGPW